MYVYRHLSLLSQLSRYHDVPATGRQKAYNRFNRSCVLSALSEQANLIRIIQSVFLRLSHFMLGSPGTVLSPGSHSTLTLSVLVLSHHYLLLFDDSPREATSGMHLQSSQFACRATSMGPTCPRW